MFSKKSLKIVGVLTASLMVLGACSNDVDVKKMKTDIMNEVKQEMKKESEPKKIEGIQNVGPHEGINQEPVPVNVERVSETEVNIEMTSQITDIEIANGKIYKAWTFNGTVPGPVVRVKEGDWINFKMLNMDPKIPHSLDWHSVYTSPHEGYADVMPNEEGTFRYQAGSPGVYMYHCATDPVLQHIANGMYGIMIVEPRDGYPTDDEIDREYTVVQSEWYEDGDWNEMLNEEPMHVVFNGTVQSLKDNPLKAKVGEKVRIYFNNVGPNEISSFHVIGTQLETVYIDGDPRNVQYGLQTVAVPASGGVIVEFTVREPGTYPFVTHQFDHVTKGASGIIEVTE